MPRKKKQDGPPVAKAPKRRPPHGGLSDRLFDADELESLKAIDAYKREHRRPFPAWTEVLAILKALGWRKDPKKP